MSQEKICIQCKLTKKLDDFKYNIRTNTYSVMCLRCNMLKKKQPSFKALHSTRQLYDSTKKVKGIYS